MIEVKNLPIMRGNVALRYARGHFATRHSHINYYIDITDQKFRLSDAKACAKIFEPRSSTDAGCKNSDGVASRIIEGSCICEVREIEHGNHGSAEISKCRRIEQNKTDQHNEQHEHVIQYLRQFVKNRL